MAVARRMGPKGSEIWNSMLDAAEVILRDEGYGLLTSRRVAEVVGVKQRLVYYYFETMEQLIVETFQRLAVRDLERLRSALASNHSIREIWNVCIRTTDTRIVQEFMALANRIEPLRKEVRAYIEETRAMRADAISKALDRSGLGATFSPVAASIFAESAALALHREAQLGVTSGHAEVLAIIDAYLSRLDPIE